MSGKLDFHFQGLQPQFHWKMNLSMWNSEVPISINISKLLQYAYYFILKIKAKTSEHALPYSLIQSRHSDELHFVTAVISEVP